jgi:long-chain fatty acid transport protein
MKWPAKHMAAALIAVALTPAIGAAAGYAIFEQGAASLGMAGASTASIDDASAMFFNPAAMTRFDGTRLQFGGTMIAPVISFAGAPLYPGYGVTEEMKAQYFFPPAIYATHRLAPKWALGAAFNLPYGLGVDWKNPDTFTGRYLVTTASLRAYNGSVDAAYAVNPKLSVAFGVDAAMASVKLDNRILLPAPGGGGAQVDVAKAELKGDNTVGWGWNAAVNAEPDPKWKLGARYRSRIVVHEDGSANFTQIPTGNAAFDASVAAGLPPNQGASTVLRLPALWSAGAAYLPCDAWTVEGDFNFVQWSAFSDLPITFHQTPAANRVIEENYDDSWQVRVGAEHRLKTWTYRFGGYYDKHAAPTSSVSPLLPDTDRYGPSIGAGLPFGGKWTANAYWLPLFTKQRSTDGVNRDGYDGTYKTFVNLAGLSFEVRW